MHEFDNLGSSHSPDVRLASNDLSRQPEQNEITVLPESATPIAEPPSEDEPAAGPTALSYTARMLGWVIPFSIFVAVLLSVLYVAPYLMLRWRMADADAQAEAAYLKRQAELKAEAEAAEKNLKLLDKKTQLISLGFREVVRLVKPKVVNVSSYRLPKQGEMPLLPKKNTLYDPDTKRRYLESGVGSGLIAKSGFILTNHHVVREAERLRVTFASGQSVWVNVERIASDPPTDLAVVRLPEDPQGSLKHDYNQTCDFADTKDVQCGDLVIAMGSPLGLKHTVTHGVISAKGRLLEMLDKVELLQTDTPIYPGNSGGPLFDIYGRVVGINVAIASESGLNQGIGFAIPSNTAKTILNDLIEKGEVVRGFIGIKMDDVSPEKAKELALKDKGGVLVREVIPDYPAAKAGLRAGDIIVAVGDTPIPINDSYLYFRQRIMEKHVGDDIHITVLRDQEFLQLTITVGARPADHLLR